MTQGQNYNIRTKFEISSSSSLTLGLAARSDLENTQIEGDVNSTGGGGGELLVCEKERERIIKARMRIAHFSSAVGITAKP